MLPAGGNPKEEAMSAKRTLFYRLFMQPGSLLMERKMALGIKQRAERLARDRRRRAQAAAGSG